MRHWRLILLVLGLIGIGYLLHRYVPPQHNPWRPPDLTEPIGLATYNKLTDLKHDRALCLAKLTEAGVEFVAVRRCSSRYI